MSVSRIAIRYAKPLLDLAVEKKVLDKVKADMENFIEICKENRQFTSMLRSPIIAHLKKAEVLNKIFKGKVNDLTLSALTIITITTLGVMASFIPAVRSLQGTFQLGMYLILVFCLTTGSMTDTGIITNLNLDLFAYIGFILIGSLLLQAIICRVMNIDTDTFLITSSAAIMSVPFIPVIAGALKNREIILPGFAAAIIGYILGNYLGIAMAFATRAMLGS